MKLDFKCAAKFFAMLSGTTIPARLIALMPQNTHTSTLELRLDAVAAWLLEHAPYAEFDQHHLDQGTPAQAYWHLGYAAALNDVVQMLKRDSGERGNIDTSSP